MDNQKEKENELANSVHMSCQFGINLPLKNQAMKADTTKQLEQEKLVVYSDPKYKTIKPKKTLLY